MKKIIIISIAIIAVIIYILSVNTKPQVIKIGLVAGLSGKYSLLGDNIKDGITLAFDEIGYKINETKIELIQKDDKQDNDENAKVVKELIQDGVKIILGNGTSSMAEVTLDIIKNHPDVLLFSPTVSSHIFNGIDDNFIRVQVSNTPSRFTKLSKYFLDNKIETITSIYDPNNLSFSMGYIKSFEKSFIKSGGKKFVNYIPLSDSFETIKEKIANDNVDAIVLATNTLDTAKLLQYFKINNIDKTILSSDWTKGKSFLEEAGKAAEGVLFYTSYDTYATNEKYLDFVKKFEKKYNKKPSLFSIQSYETAKILIDILKKDIDLNNVKTNIINQSIFEGMQGKIVFDKFGDVQREQFMVIVKDGKYIRLD